MTCLMRNLVFSQKRISTRLLRFYSSASELPSFDTLAVTVPKKHVFHVELNRPKKLNTFNNNMWLELKSCFDALSENPECRVVLLSGQGKHFTAGIDISSLMENTSEINDAGDIARQTRLVSKFLGISQPAEGTVVDPVQDSKALAKICLAVKPALYQYVRDATSAKDAWKKLADTFEPQGLYRKVLLLRQLHRVDYKQYNGMSEYIEAVMRLVQQLADIGKPIEDGEVAEILLSGLPQEFDNLVSGMETACLTQDLTVELVRARLLQEEHRKSNGDQELSNAYLTNKHKKSPLFCQYCKRTGHNVKRCFKKKRNEQQRQKQQEEDHTMLTSASALTCQVNPHEFVVDSGASQHMVSEKDLLSDPIGIDLNSFMEKASDINEAGDIARQVRYMYKTIGLYQDGITSLEKCVKPVLVVSHNACIGAGVDLITAADMRYCTEDCWFQVKEVDIGLAADVGTLQRLPKVIGNTSTAREWCFTGRKIDAKEALSSGLVSKVYKDKEAAIIGVTELAENIAAKSPVAVQTTKRSLVYSQSRTNDEGLAHIRLMNQAMLLSEDLSKSAMAAVAKEQAEFDNY